MTLNEPLLQKLNEWRPSGPGRHVLAVPIPEAGWTAVVTADRADATGCLLWEVSLNRNTPAPAGLTLHSWAEKAAKRVTGLLEPLAVHEVDAARGEAVLRSQAPAQRGTQLSYYELLLRGTGSATLRRYQASRQPGGHREQAAFALTHEALAKAAEDVTAVA